MVYHLSMRAMELQQSPPNTEPNGGLTPEEIAAWDQAYDKYSALRMAYEGAIKLEEDPQRKRVLEGLLEDLNEDNK